MENMKTSLTIEDSLFKAAQQESQRKNQTLSQTISYWARVGREALKLKKKSAPRRFKAVDLGGTARIELSSRRHWMDTLDL